MEYHSLDMELEYFDQNRTEWLKHHFTKFALIKRNTVHGFYDTSENAYKAGVDLWGKVPFLIKEVQLVDEVIFMPIQFIVKMIDEDQD